MVIHIQEHVLFEIRLDGLLLHLICPTYISLIMSSLLAYTAAGDFHWDSVRARVYCAAGTFKCFSRLTMSQSFVLQSCMNEVMDVVHVLSS